MDSVQKHDENTRLTVLLVDDQRLFVESLRVFMNTRAEDLEVVGVAYDGAEAVEMTRTLRPSLVVMDVRMPGMDGVQACRTITSEIPDTKVLMLTTFDDDEYVFEAMKTGAVGYLLKDLDPSELVETMRAAISGSVQISPQIATRLVSHAYGPKASDHRRRTDNRFETDEALADELWNTLSRREQEIIRLIAEEYDNGEIADRLNLAVQTVKNHISSIYEKLEVHSRIRLIRLCHAYGWDQTD